MLSPKKETAILLLSCPDQKGIVAEISQFIFHYAGNIIYSDQHTDFDSHTFFMRIEWEMDGFLIPKDQITDRFAGIAEKFQMNWKLHFSQHCARMAIMVSRLDHCLYDILLKKQSGEMQAQICAVISNHEDLKPVADYFGIPYYYFPVEPQNKAAVETKELELMRELHVDFLVLARYMQVLSPSFISKLPNQIINIHHSFLPAFIGAKPYHQAFERGVKLIGATSHYVTAELDNGPIIAQDVIRISHRDSVEDLIRKGKELEKVVLSRAIKSHLEHKTLVFHNKTIVFD